MSNRLYLLVAAVLPLTAQTPAGEPLFNAIRQGNRAEVAKLIAHGREYSKPRRDREGACMGGT